jgi:hypothetical protein
MSRHFTEDDLAGISTLLAERGARNTTRTLKPMNNETTPVNLIERQLSKLESTATNLQTLSVLATRANRTQEAKALSDQAVDLRVKQFILYRNKSGLQVDTKEWKALVSALELVNHFIDEAINDLKVIKDVQDSVARLVSVAAKIAAAYEDKVSK